MSLKSWVLDRVHRMNDLVGRADLPPLDTAPAPLASGSRTPPTDSPLPDAEHLGAYAALIAAIRDELEHFVASHVRLHLAIADHDRFVLSSIGVDSAGGGDARLLLQQFMREFKPEQVKRYLAREVIAGLPNASAIDLSQFAGLIDLQARDEAGEDSEYGEYGEYGELIDALRIEPLQAASRPYQISIVGRWSELETARPTAPPQPRSGAALTTPLAGLRCEFDVEDGDGRRRVVLQSVVAGRRYAIGKGEGCDIRVDGTYTSRRHGEIWLEQGAWWVGDTGSTNGIRLEWPTGSIERCGGPSSGGEALPVKLLDGARIVLSAQAQGPASDYPWLALRAPETAAARITPITPIAQATPRTPLTPILLGRSAGGALTLTARLASGERRLELGAAALPFAIGRSRNQQLVIDRVHDAVSGHHLDIVAIDGAGAEVMVHGDNGVVVDGVLHEAGSRLRWQLGETMVLGGGLHDHPACDLVLSCR
jgi:hypothetical protein